MKKEALKKHIATTAYNIGYGAKKHLATYDIVEKGPGWIGFLSIAAGIFALILLQLEGLSKSRPKRGRHLCVPFPRFSATCSESGRSVQ